MKDADSDYGLVSWQNTNLQLQDSERQLLIILKHLYLPSESIYVTVDERMAVINNLERVLQRIDLPKRRQSAYLSKFVVAVASGLFDAALNYLWDETISELRKKVARYDLSYFYDNISNIEKRKLSSEEDLEKIDDNELIDVSKRIGLISEIGYQRLALIKYMRNAASTAHPNQNEITGLDLVNWLETCIREVISVDTPSYVVSIKQLLTNIKTNSMSDIDARETAVLCTNLPKDQLNNLVSGLFGTFTRIDTTPQTRQNIRILIPLLWDRVDENTRQKFGSDYSKYAAAGDQERKKLVREFLELVSATSYLSDDFRIVAIDTVLDNLLLAHRATDFKNFYSEPPFARELERLVGSEGKVPQLINRKYVHGMVEVFLTNGYGVARNAEPIYKSLIDLFDSNQILIAVLSFDEDHIAGKLQISLCQKKYLELLSILKVKVSMAALKELIEEIETYKHGLDRLRKDSRFKQKASNLIKIISK